MKQKIGSQNALYPMPVTLVGALVDGKVNFVTIAHVGILNARSPHLISLGINKAHYTNAGIKANRTFSVNIPSQDMVVETDYMGLVSGRDTDKSTVFEVVFGELQTAPMIKDCPVSMECRLHEIVDNPTHDIFVGEIVATYVDDSVLTDGRIDLAKVRPMLFDMSSKQYWALGQAIGRAWHVGRQLKQTGEPT